MITVFTPTYNRAGKLHRVYDSLCNQTFKDFEWVVVDDGSTDGIIELINEYKSKSNFPITFYKFDTNRGKHNATNKALELSTRQFFVVADSDDSFTVDALQFFIVGWFSIPENDRVNYCGIRACCEDQLGNRVSDVLPFEPLDASMQEAFYTHKFKRESWCMVHTEWHRKFLFKEDHVGYYPEGIIWKAMSIEKKLRFFNKATRIYYIEDDPNSLMNNKKPAISKINRNLIGGYDVLANDISFFKHSKLDFFKTALQYAAYSFLAGRAWFNFKSLPSQKAKFLYVATAPAAYFFMILKLRREN